MSANTWALGNADGIVFVLQDSGLGAIGPSCSNTSICHGYVGITNSIGVAFNSYLANSISFHTGGSGTKLANAPAPPNFDDDNWHTATISYDSAGKLLSVYTDNQFQFIVNVDLNSVGFTNGYAYIGFTASTGNYFYSTQDISSFSFSIGWVVIGVDVGGVVARRPALIRKINNLRIVDQTSISKSFIRENGRILSSAGVPGSFTVDARDSCGQPRYGVSSAIYDCSPPFSVVVV